MCSDDCKPSLLVPLFDRIDGGHLFGKREERLTRSYRAESHRLQPRDHLRYRVKVGVSIEHALLLSPFIGLPERGLAVNHPHYDTRSRYKNSLRFSKGLHWVVGKTKRGYHHDKIERLIVERELFCARLVDVYASLPSYRCHCLCRFHPDFDANPRREASCADAHLQPFATPRENAWYLLLLLTCRHRCESQTTDRIHERASQTWTLTSLILLPTGIFNLLPIYEKRAKEMCSLLQSLLLSTRRPPPQCYTGRMTPSLCR